MRRLLAVVSLAAVGLVEPAAVGAEERLETGYIALPAGAGQVSHADPESRILYLNRCAGGCTISPGYDDSRRDRSSIINSTAQIPEYPWGDESWERVVDCVQTLYSRFDIEVTDIDPGETAHFEAIVAGDPTDIGMRPQVGGVAPFTCGVIENAITFTFAGRLSGPQQICEVIGQESAHAFGLDHELLCQDPMTYLSGCGSKCFRDVDAECGEQDPRRCSCGGETQNSFQRITELFGERESQPTVSIYEPTAGGLVQGGFNVRINGRIPCMSQVSAAIVVDGEEIDLGTISNWPYVFDAPDQLRDGPVTVKVTATDVDGMTYDDVIEVTVGAAPLAPDAGVCTDDCGGGQGGSRAGGGACSTGGDRAGGLLLLGFAALVVRRRRR